jgi:GT2 family glycosyltransferase
VFLDSDVRLESDWIAQQASFLEADRTVGIVCGALVSAEAPHVLQATYGAMNRYAVAWDAGGGESPERFAAPRFCLWAISAAMMVRRDVFDAIGGFDERLFAFHEDSDLGWRANLAGRRVAYNPRARARHQEHSTMNSSTMSGRITYLLFRNRIRSALVNYEWHNAARYLPVHVTLALLDGVARPPRMAKLRAIAWNLSNLGDTLRRRQITQRVRRVRDRDLWPLFEPGLRGPGRVLW